MDKINFLPLGSVVLLNGGTQKVLVVARGVNAKDGDETYFFDYGGVPYPTGVVGDQMAFFNQSGIERVFFEGYRDDDNQIMVDRLNDYIERNPGLKRRSFDQGAK